MMFLQDHQQTSFQNKIKDTQETKVIKIFKSPFERQLEFLQDLQLDQVHRLELPHKKN